MHTPFKKTFILSTIPVLFLSSLLAFKPFQVQALDTTKILTTVAPQEYINNYYQSVDSSMNGTTLINTLSSIIKADHKGSFSYGSLQTTAFPYTDVDPNDPYGLKIVSFYSGTSVQGYTGMNKEHVWPNSHGGNKVENDPHMARPTLTKENSARGNSYFTENPSDGWDPASFNNPKYRGIAARIIFYCVIAAKDSLSLEDVGFKSGSGNGGKMGKLSDLLKWNLEYPVDQTEIIRNETLDLSLNWSRNPFIDDPSYACRIWGDTNSRTASVCSAVGLTPTSLSLTPASVSINIGNEATLTVNPTPSTASKSVTWSSANNSIATISNGKITPKAVGSTVITATSTLDSSIKATANVTVTNDPIPVTGVSLSSNSVNLSLGKKTTLTALITPNTASNKGVTWSSLDASIASVNANGEITALKVGTTTIKVTTQDGNFSASANINVTAASNEIEVVGSFYNNTTDNNGGESGVTAANLNNGIATNQALGFKGSQVVQKLTVTQGYFPRSGGLALGSSNNSGSLSLTFTENYHPLKIQARFNDAGKGGSVTLSASSQNTPVNGTLTAGTLGTAFSKPSSGNPYILEFPQTIDTLNITTSVRIALVELTLYVGEENHSYDETLSWSSSFLEETSYSCSIYDANGLQTSWSSLKTDFLSLSMEAKTLLKYTPPNVYGDEIEQAITRYIYILQKYNFENFLERGEIYQAPESSFQKPGNPGIIVAFLLGILFITVIIVYKKNTKEFN